MRVNILLGEITCRYSTLPRLEPLMLGLRARCFNQYRPTRLIIAWEFCGLRRKNIHRKRLMINYDDRLAQVNLLIGSHNIQDYKQFMITHNICAVLFVYKQYNKKQSVFI